MLKLILIALITLGINSAHAENTSENTKPESEAVTDLGEIHEAATPETTTPEVTTSETPTTEVAPEVTISGENDSTATTNNAATEEEKKEEVPELPEMNCSDMFLQWVRQQPAKNQEKYSEAYFLSTDAHTYRQHKQDEFVWREKEAEYKKQFKDLLAKLPKIYVLSANVVLGKYDFKKKGFPVEIQHSKEGVLENAPSGGGYLSFSMAKIPNAGQIYCRGFHEEPKYPTHLTVAVQKIQGPKFLAVDEALGKEITSQLRTNRQVYSRFEVEVVSLVTKPGILNKKEQYFLLNTKVKKADILLNNQTYNYKF